MSEIIKTIRATPESNTEWATIPDTIEIHVTQSLIDAMKDGMDLIDKHPAVGEIGLDWKHCPSCEFKDAYDDEWPDPSNIRLQTMGFRFCKKFVTIDWNFKHMPEEVWLSLTPGDFLDG